ncbi:MAG: type II secretion system protein [Candidatus Firestonebacteria bacterium]
MMRRRVRNKGFTLVEVLVSVAFISLVYSFVVQLFFSGFKDINIGDVQEEAARLANNEMVRLASIENPLYVGLLEMGSQGAELIDQLKAGTMTPSQLVEDNIITLNRLETVGQIQTADNNTEIKSSSETRADFTRTVEWEVKDVDPVLVSIKVTVNWVDPRGEIKDGDFLLETQLSN